MPHDLLSHLAKANTRDQIQSPGDHRVNHRWVCPHQGRRSVSSATRVARTIGASHTFALPKVYRHDLLTCLIHLMGPQGEGTVHCCHPASTRMQRPAGPIWRVTEAHTLRAKADRV